MNFLKLWLPILVTACILVGVELRSVSLRSQPEEATAYLAACRESATSIPYSLPSGWIGQDTEVPTIVDDILRPNVLVSRAYDNLAGTGRAGLLLVQTADVQRLLGHYPPACYPGRGWNNLGGEPADWTIGDLDINGTIYRMVPPGGDMDQPIYIYNFILRPDGETGRDMDAVWTSGRSGRSRYFGAGQVQVLFYGNMTADAREAVFASIVQACEPAITQILDGYAAE